MTYPGLPGQVGPKPSTTVGWQARQSKAGRAHRGPTVLDSMANPPAAGVVGENVSVIADEAKAPFTIEQDNFEAAGKTWHPDVSNANDPAVVNIPK